MRYKAISIKQPWAWLILNAGKDIENRVWPTTHRGPILIHAGKKIDNEGYDYVKENYPDVDLPPHYNLERGGIVGVVNIVDCVESHKSRWFYGPFGFVLSKPKNIPFLSYKGQLQIFNVDIYSQLHNNAICFL